MMISKATFASALRVVADAIDPPKAAQASAAVAAGHTVTFADVSGAYRVVRWLGAVIEPVLGKPSASGALDVTEEVLAAVATIDPALIPEAGVIEAGLKLASFVVAHQPKDVVYPPLVRSGKTGNYYQC